MYEAIKSTLLKFLVMPFEPPPPPPGAVGDVRVFRASRRYLLLQLIRMGIGAAIFVIIDGILLVVALTSGAPPRVALIPLLVFGIVGLILLLRYFVIRLEYEMRYYLVTDRSLRIRAGVLKLTEVTLTFANIQAINISQNFIQRWFGISDLAIQTAGGGGGAAAGGHAANTLAHRSVLRGIDNPEQMRDEIMALVKKFRDAGLGDPEDAKKAAIATGEEARIQRLREIRDELRVLRQRLGA